MTSVRPDAPAHEAAHPQDDPPDGGDVTIVVCSSCRKEHDPKTTPRPGASLVEDARAAAHGSDVRVLSVACLGNCNRGLSAAMLKPGAWSYVFGGLETTSGADLVAGAQLFAASQDGFMPFRDRPQSLKSGLVARVPSFGNLEDLS